MRNAQDTSVYNTNGHVGPPFGEEGAKHFGDMLQVNRTIRELCIVNCNISLTGISYLSDGLKYNDTLQESLLSPVSQNLGDGHLQQLCPGLAVNRGLETLDLMVGSFTEKGLGYLTKVVEEHNFVLETVILGQNLNNEDDLIKIGPGTLWNKLCYYLQLN